MATDGVAEDEHPMVEAEVDQMIRDYAAVGRPIDYLGLARSTDEGIAAGNLEPDDPDFWRAVAAELRRRAGDV